MFIFAIIFVTVFVFMSLFYLYFNAILKFYLRIRKKNNREAMTINTQKIRIFNGKRPIPPK